MKTPVRIDGEARAELREAVRSYEEQRPGLGTKLLDAIDRALALLQDSRLVGSMMPDIPGCPSARRLPLRRFPFSIVYVDQGDHIYVLAFAHSRRRPGYWRKRSP